MILEHMIESGGCPLGAPRTPSGPVHGTHEPFRPVWVNLAALFPDPDPPRPLAVDGLDMSVGQAPGVVHYWTRAGSGLWIACTSYTVRYLDGRIRHLEYQFVPETLLRKRADGD
jgi:hypothetical protein